MKLELTETEINEIIRKYYNLDGIGACFEYRKDEDVELSLTYEDV